MNCPKCKQEFKLIPAGVSKTSGKPYKAFYSCQVCHITANVDGSPTKAKAPIMQGGNSEVMNALREVYKLLERIDKKVDTLSNMDSLDITEDIEDIKDIFKKEE